MLRDLFILTKGPIPDRMNYAYFQIKVRWSKLTAPKNAKFNGTF